jgi:hypothetical protein
LQAILCINQSQILVENNWVQVTESLHGFPEALHLFFSLRSGWWDLLAVVSLKMEFVTREETWREVETTARLVNLQAAAATE